MANLVTPTLFINMTCELVYIIERKLKEEGYDRDVINPFLCSLLSAFSSKDFTDALFSLYPDVGLPYAQDDILHDRLAMRALLQKLCSSSGMTLDGESMDRVMEIQLVFIKYQMMCASSVLDVTVTHLQEMYKVAEYGQNQAVLTALVDLKARYEAAFAKLSMGDAMDLRMRLLAYVQDWRCDVNIMLTSGMLAEDLSVNYDMCCAEGAPKHGERPGTIRFFDSKGAVRTKRAFDPMAVTRGSFLPPSDMYDGVPCDPPLGTDMFALLECPKPEEQPQPQEPPPPPPQDPPYMVRYNELRKTMTPRSWTQTSCWTR